MSRSADTRDGLRALAARIGSSVIQAAPDFAGEPAWLIEARLASLNRLKSFTDDAWQAALPSGATDAVATLLNDAASGTLERRDASPPSSGAALRLLRRVVSGVEGASPAPDPLPTSDLAPFYSRVRAALSDQGITFQDTNSALADYPGLLRHRVEASLEDPLGGPVDALAGAFWRGGVVAHVPAGCVALFPLQPDYLPPGAAHGGPFQRTVIVAEPGSTVQFIDGCVAPVYSTTPLRVDTVDLIAGRNADVSYISFQNRSPNVTLLGSRRARIEAGATVRWTEVHLGGGVLRTAPRLRTESRTATADIRVLSLNSSTFDRDVAPIVEGANGEPPGASAIVTRTLTGVPLTTRGDPTPARISATRTGRGAGSAWERASIDARELAWPPPVGDAGVPTGDFGGTGASVQVLREFMEPILRALPVEYAVDVEQIMLLHLQNAVG